MMQVNWKVLAALMLGGTVALTGCADSVEPDTDIGSDVDETDAGGDGGTDPDGTTDPDVGDTSDPDAGDVTDPDAGDVTDPDTGDVTDPDTGDVTDPDTGDVTDAGDVTDPDAGDVTDPDAGDVTDPDAGDVTDPDAGDVTDPDAGDVTDGGDTTGAECGNNTVEAGEECDDGIDNDDRLPNACRTNCELPTCGDGVTDDGEQCDDGAENGVDAACSNVCEINLDLACEGVVLLDAAEVGESIRGVLLVQGEIAAGAGDSAPPIDCGTGAGTGGEVVVAWTPTASGIYRISTDNPATLADTTLYLTDSCIDGLPSACDAGAGLGVGGTLLVNDIEAGVPYFIVVDSDDLFGGAFTLTIQPVAAIAGEGDSCVTATCDVGLTCVEGLCEVPLGDVAPTLTSLTALSITPTLVRFSFEGTDPNEDVNNIVIETVVFDNGDIYGDTPDEAALNLTNDIVPTWADGEFTFFVNLDLTTLSDTATAVAGATMAVIDSTGLESNSLDVEVAPFVEPPAVGEGEACDIEGITATCEEPFVCGWVGTETICGDSIAPVIDSVTAEWIEADVVNHIITGTDPNNDLVDGLASVNFEGGPFDLAFDFDSVDYDGENFVAEVAITGIGTVGATDSDVSVFDFDGNESNIVNVDYIAPTLIGLGGACGAGVDGICQAGLLCSPVTTGGRACLADSAPVLSRLEGFYLEADENIVQFNFDGSDINGDFEFAQIRLLILIDGEVLSTDFIDVPASDFTPDPTGRTVFRATSPQFPTGPNVFFEIEMSLFDAQGNQSETLTDALGSEGGLGETCEAGSLAACADGLTCGAAGTCETPAAPVAVSAEIARFVVEEVELTVTGTDANGDVEVVVARAFNIDGEPLVDLDGEVLEFQFAFETSVAGLTSFVATTIFGVDETIGSIDFELLDASGLRSNTLSIDLPAVVAAGGDCIGDPSVDVCTSPTLCVEGVCAVDSAEPCGAGVAVFDFFEELQTDIDGFEFIAGTFGATGVLGAGCPGAAAGPEDAYVYTAPGTGRAFFSTDNDVTAPVDTVLFLTEGVCLPPTPAVVCDDDGGDTGFTSVLAASVEAGVEYYLLVDTFSATSGAARPYEVDYFFIPANQPVGEFCLDSIDCEEGLLCDENTCVEPVLGGVCEGITTFPISVGVNGSATAAGASALLPRTCGGTAAGPEVVFEFVAPASGSFVATVETPTGYDSVMSVTAGDCRGTVIQCNDDSVGARSRVTFSAVAGLTYYLIVEGFAGAAIPTAGVTVSITGP